MSHDLDFGLWALELHKDDDFCRWFALFQAANESLRTGEVVPIGKYLPRRLGGHG